MSKKRTDFRALQARRDFALTRPELRLALKPSVDAEAIAAAINAGRLTRVPARRRAR